MGNYTQFDLIIEDLEKFSKDELKQVRTNFEKIAESISDELAIEPSFIIEENFLCFDGKWSEREADLSEFSKLYPDLKIVLNELLSDWDANIYNAFYKVYCKNGEIEIVQGRVEFPKTKLW